MVSRSVLLRILILTSREIAAYMQRNFSGKLERDSIYIAGLTVLEYSCENLIWELLTLRVDCFDKKIV